MLHQRDTTDRATKPLKAEAVDPILPRRELGGTLPRDVGRGLTPEQYKALNSKARRDMLRALAGAPEAQLTVEQLGAACGDDGLGSGAFHLQLLVGLGFVAPAEVRDGGAGGRRPGYVSTAADDPTVVAVLKVLKVIELSDRLGRL